MNAAKVEKFKRKVNKIIGVYGSSEGAGQDIIIKKYTYSKNNYGDITKTYDSEQTTKGIIISDNSEELQLTGDITNKAGYLRIIIPIDYEVQDTDTYVFEFVVDDITYTLERAVVVGRLSNTTGIYTDLLLRPTR